MGEDDLLLDNGRASRPDGSGIGVAFRFGTFLICLSGGGERGFRKALALLTICSSDVRGRGTVVVVVVGAGASGEIG